MQRQKRRRDEGGDARVRPSPAAHVVDDHRHGAVHAHIVRKHAQVLAQQFQRTHLVAHAHLALGEHIAVLDAHGGDGGTVVLGGRSLSVAVRMSTTSGMLAKATRASSRTTRSADTPVRRERRAIIASTRARMPAFSSSRGPFVLALFGEYPARIAARVAFRSIRYSSQNRCCFAVTGRPPFRVVAKRDLPAFRQSPMVVL